VHLAGVVLIVVGIAVISWEQSETPDATHDGTVRDLAFPLLAALLFAVEPLFAKVGFAAGTPFLVGLAVKTLGFSAYLWHVDQLPRIADVRHDAFRWYVGAGVANTVFVLALYASLSVAPVTVVIPIIQSSPLFVVLLSYVFLRDIEQITPTLVAGVGVVVVGGSFVVVFG
jgi:uncharacterized membrane protein